MKASLATTNFGYVYNLKVLTAVHSSCKQCRK